jgi:hypothetical protein
LRLRLDFDGPAFRWHWRLHIGIFNPGCADEAGGSPVQIKTYWTEWREANQLLVYSPGLVLSEWNLS